MRQLLMASAASLALAFAGPVLAQTGQGSGRPTLTRPPGRPPPIMAPQPVRLRTRQVEPAPGRLRRTTRTAARSAASDRIHLPTVSRVPSIGCSCNRGSTPPAALRRKPPARIIRPPTAPIRPARVATHQPVRIAAPVARAPRMRAEPTRLVRDPRAPVGMRRAIAQTREALPRSDRSPGLQHSVLLSSIGSQLLIIQV